MALYLQQKTAPAWGGYSQFRGPSHALSLAKTTLPFTAIEVEAMAARRALKLAQEIRFQ